MKKLFLYLATLLFIVACSVGTSDVPNGYESQKLDSDKIDSVIKNNILGIYKLQIDGSNLNLTIGMREQDLSHYRRRGFYINRLIYKMSNYMDSIHLASVKITELPDFEKACATYTFNYSDIQNHKKWPEKDPIFFYFMSLAAEMNNDKYEEFAQVANFFSTGFEDEKKLNTFDPDLAYFIEKFVNEIYGATKGLRQRQIMEAFYESTFDPEINAKHIAPEDILQFTNYADSVYYMKAFPTEMKTLLDKRLKPNK